MRCGHVRKRLSALQDGEVAPSERVQLEEHLDGCQACQAVLARLELPQPALQVPPEIGRLLWEKVRATPVLARVRQAAPATPAAPQRWWRWLDGEVGISRGMLVGYAAVLAAVVLWGATAWWPSADGAGTVVVLGEELSVLPHDTAPSSHTGLPARDILPSEWQNASYPAPAP